MKRLVGARRAAAVYRQRRGLAEGRTRPLPTPRRGRCRRVASRLVAAGRRGPLLRRGISTASAPRNKGIAVGRGPVVPTGSQNDDLLGRADTPSRCGSSMDADAAPHQQQHGQCRDPLVLAPWRVWSARGSGGSVSATAGGGASGQLPGRERRLVSWGGAVGSGVRTAAHRLYQRPGSSGPLPRTGSPCRGWCALTCYRWGRDAGSAARR